MRACNPAWGLISRYRRSPPPLPILAAKLSLSVGISICFIALPEFLRPPASRPLPVPIAALAFARAQKRAFLDLIPFRARVVPRETIHIDAIDGGRVDRVLVEPGDLVQQGQTMIELSNTNLSLQVIQQASQLNQAISQLQQNEISLEQNRLSNERALADIEYHIVRLERAVARRESLTASGASSIEQRDLIADELRYYKELKPIQAESVRRQAELRSRLLFNIQQQLILLRQNLDIVHTKLDSLLIRAPIAGRVTAIDLKVGENRSPGQRLAEVTPQTGMRLVASIEEHSLGVVHGGQSGVVNVQGHDVSVTVRRVSPQIRGGLFDIELEFTGDSPATLVAGATLTGHLISDASAPATVLPAGPYIDSTSGRWVFVVASDNRSAHRRPIQVGRRTSQQLEILSGVFVEEKIITSTYAGMDKANSLLLVE